MSSLLQLKDLQKRFGTLEVLHDVNLMIEANEIVGLAGMSGSGKSVVAQIIAGLYQPQAGTIHFDNQQLVFPYQGHKIGIEVIHQYPTLVESLSISSNVYLGYEIMYGWFGNLLKIPNQAVMDKEAQQILHDLGLSLADMSQKVINLSNEQRQIIAIARAIVRPTKLIVIDEPTMLLGYPQQQKLLSLIQYWRQNGKTIIFSSTNLDHLFTVTDRIVVLRDGETVGSFRTDEATREDVVAAMVGQPNQERLTPIIWALDNYYAAREKADLVVEQANSLEQDLMMKDTLNQELLSTLATQVKALDQANAALQDAQRRLLTEREQERKYVARELHDQVIQDLLSTNYELETIEAHMQDTVELASIRHNIRGMVEDIRRICGNLRPPTIDSLGLSAAVQSFTNEWSRRTNIDISLRIEKLGRLPEATELSIFRIIQESLSNIKRHAAATQVEILIEHTSPRTLMVTIADNGEGMTTDEFDLSQLSSKGHYGLLGISERVALLSGHLRLQNRADGGLMIQVQVPHPRVEADIHFPTV